MRKNTARKLWFWAFLLGVFMAGCGKEVEDIINPPAIPPAVISTTPANGAIGVAVNQIINANFNKVMDPTTFTSATFTLTGPGTTPVAGTVAYSGTSATFTSAAALAANTIFTATITTGVKDPIMNALANNFVWNFTTGTAPSTVPPTVILTNPANLATGVGINSKIAATFSEAMDPATITAATFTVTGPGTTAVAGTVAFDVRSNIATFTPTSNLAASTQFSATITTGAKDLGGNSLVSNYVWSFTTGAAPDTTPPTVSLTTPANGATSVATNSKVTATFSKAMDPTTIIAANFTVTGPGTTSVAGIVTYLGASNTATFTPGSNLAANTLFTATITTGVKDLAGNALATNFVWSFTTAATPSTTPPTVISTVPANLATAVPINQKITATFSAAMDPTTISTATFTLAGPGTTAVPGTVTYGVANNTATFSPASNLAGSTTFTATITNGVKDLAGNAMVLNFVWTFTTTAGPDLTPPTVVSTNPANLATGVVINKKINATFSKPMDPTTITTASFKLAGPGVTVVVGTVTYDVPSQIATFVPTSNLAPSTTFTATITNTVKDLAGNAMVSNFVWSFTTGTQSAQAPLDLRSAGRYAILAGSTVTNTGPTIVNGDLGLSPGTAVTGFPPGTVNGAIRVPPDPTIAQAKLDLTAAFNDAAGRSVGSATLAGDISGLTFTPGLYTNSTSVILSVGNVTLDAQGDTSAVFIFQMGSTLTTSPGTRVILAGGAKAANIFWEVGTSATIGTTSIFKGNIIAATAITLNTGATLEGRALTQGAAVTMDSNTVTIPLP